MHLIGKKLFNAFKIIFYGYIIKMRKGGKKNRDLFDFLDAFTFDEMRNKTRKKKNETKSMIDTAVTSVRKISRNVIKGTGLTKLKKKSKNLVKKMRNSKRKIARKSKRKIQRTLTKVKKKSRKMIRKITKPKRSKIKTTRRPKRSRKISRKPRKTSKRRTSKR